MSAAAQSLSVQHLANSSLREEGKMLSSINARANAERRQVRSGGMHRTSPTPRVLRRSVSDDR